MQAAATNFLNAQQTQAVENIRDHMLLLAGAGTGKTNTLAWRVANLLTVGGVKPEEILCLTFTNRACKEMSQRIARIVGEGAENVTIKTVHSFCAWLLRHTPQSLVDIGQDFTVADQADCLETIREVVFQVTERRMGERPAQILQNFIGLVKDCQLAHPAGGCGGAVAYAFVHCRPALERICQDEQYQFDPKFFGFLNKYGGSILRLYNLKLAQSNTLDFSDLLLRADALLSQPETAALWSGYFRYVHVDEVQDVSLAEYNLLTRLCKSAVVLLCGDFHQTIYQWRGSNPQGLIRRFEQDFHPLVLEFTTNYRSSGQLLAVAKEFLHHAFAIGSGGGLELSACTDVVVRSFETLPEEVHWIYQTIRDLGISDYSRVAIITRTNKACGEVCDILKESYPRDKDGIRFMLADESKLFTRGEIKDLLACIQLLANPQDRESLKRVLTRLVRGVGEATVEGIIRSYQESLGVSLTDFADPRILETGDYFDPLLDALAAGKVVVFDVESTGTDVFTDDIIQMAAVRLDQSGQITARFERFLRPSKPVGSSEAVHHFSDAMLAEQGVEPVLALTEFLDFVKGCVIVGHNVNFDRQITDQNLRRAGIPYALDPLFYDTLDLSRRFLKKLENHKLITVAAALGSNADPTHNAMDDILATAQVLTALVREYLIPQNEARRQCYGKFLPKFTAFAGTMAELKAAIPGCHPPEIAALLMHTFGLEERYKDEPEKLANLKLFLEFIEEYTPPDQPPEQQLAALLEITALSAGALDRMTRVGNKAAVITAHQSKGCEFDYVFLPVMQEGVFPTFQAVKSGDLNEEKRVFYVSITRAKQKLFLSHSRYTLQQYSAKPSRFLEMLGLDI